jgi:hypothetical protein
MQQDRLPQAATTGPRRQPAGRRSAVGISNRHLDTAAQAVASPSEPDPSGQCQPCFLLSLVNSFVIEHQSPACVPRANLNALQDTLLRRIRVLFLAPVANF